eukprot:6458931-Amphidinium_carterae.1
MERGGLVAIVHRVTEATHGVIRGLMSALGHIRWHVWQIILSPELQVGLTERLSDIGSPQAYTEKQALELVCKELAHTAEGALGVHGTSEHEVCSADKTSAEVYVSDVYPSEHVEADLHGPGSSNVRDDVDEPLLGAFEDPPPLSDVPIHETPPVDFDAFVPADLDGLEVEPGYDSLEELPEEDREQLARLANSSVRRGVRRAHAALGHPHKRVLVRMLQLAGASRPAVEYARQWVCPACQERAMPQRARPATSTFRPTAFNAAVHLDIKYVRTVDHKLWIFLSMVDGASGYHAACLLKTRDSSYVANKFIRNWIGVYGAPATVYVDQGGEFMGAFMGVLEAFAIPSKVAGTAAAWQHGVAERHGAVLAWILAALMHEHGINSAVDLKTALAASCSAKNAQLRRSGYSPEQMVFGRSMTWMSDLTNLGIENPALPQHTLDGEVWKATVMRSQAAQAFARLAVSSRMRRLMLKNVPVQREFWPGQMVYFYTEARRRSRHVPDGKFWRGPATVLAREGERRYYVSWRSRLLLCAGEQLRPASVRETRMHEILTESSLKDSLAPAQTARAIDVRPGQRGELAEDTPVPPSIEVILPTRILPAPEAERTSGRIRRPLPEIARMITQRRLRARRQSQGSVQLPVVKRRRESVPEAEMHRTSTGEPETRRPRLEAPPQPPETHDHDDEEFWREVGMMEDQYVQEGPPLAEPVSQPWRDDFTDVPLQLRHQTETSALLAEAGKSWKEHESRIQVSLVGSKSLQSLLNQLLLTVQAPSEGETGKDRWLTRCELRTLRRMLHYPLTCVRLHGVQRKVLCKSPKADLVRITVYHDEVPVGENGSWSVRVHGPEEMEGTQGKTKRPWKGLSCFFRVPKKMPAPVVQIPNGALAEVNVQDSC